MHANHLITILKNMKDFNFPSIKTILKIALPIVLLILMAIFFSALTKGRKISGPHTRSGFFFDTIIEISIYDSLTNEDSEKILSECLSLCEKYENLFSKTISGSDVYRINHESTIPVKVDSETISLVEYAVNTARLSSGLVDPTVGSLTSLWNIASDDFSLPSDPEISQALSCVDYRQITIDSEKQTITLGNPDAAIDLGFVAKGYIADRLRDYLESRDVKSALINLGGNILTLGNKPDGSDFKIGIKNPKDPGGAPITSVCVKGKSVVSSGAYERNVTIDGITYHHILSTKNGYPAESDLSGVTIISENSIDGDALSTLLFILGKDEAEKFLNKNYPDIQAILISVDSDIIFVNR